MEISLEIKGLILLLTLVMKIQLSHLRNVPLNIIGKRFYTCLNQIGLECISQIWMGNQTFVYLFSFSRTSKIKKQWHSF